MLTGRAAARAAVGEPQFRFVCACRWLVRAFGADPLEDMFVRCSCGCAADGGAAATGVALYYLLRDDGGERRKREVDPKKLSKDDVSLMFFCCCCYTCCYTCCCCCCFRGPEQQISAALADLRNRCSVLSAESFLHSTAVDLPPPPPPLPDSPSLSPSHVILCPVAATKEQVLAVLHDIFTTQEKMKGLMKRFTQKFLEEEFTFEEACALVAKQHPDDPLRRYGLTMADFDGLLDKFQQDQEVKEAVFSIMGSASAPNPTPQAYTMSKEQLVKVHEFMRDELQNLTKDGGGWPKTDPKVVTLAAQAKQQQLPTSPDAVASLPLASFAAAWSSLGAAQRQRGGGGTGEQEERDCLPRPFQPAAA
ncbi:hypothetical protein ACSSS7_002253 [Eimeria intestinalis]